MPTLDDFRVLHRHLITESTNSLAYPDDEAHGEFRIRPRARSLRYIQYKVHTVQCMSYLQLHWVRSRFWQRSIVMLQCLLQTIDLHTNRIEVLARFCSVSSLRSCSCSSTFFLLLLFSPERSPREILLDLDSTHNIFKDKVPKAKEEMEEKLQVCCG